MSKIDEKLFFLTFSVFSKIGPITFQKLINYFKSASKAAQADKADLIRAGVNLKIVDAYIFFRKKFNPQNYLNHLTKNQISIITLVDENYPYGLNQISDPPFLLYLKGKLLKKDQKSISIVGTRNITSYGKSQTIRFTSDLVENGYTIVSGLAYGVDILAHQTAINASGRTIAVLGSGINVVYPINHLSIYEKIITGHGAVLSEFPPNTQPKKQNFLIRNRIISGLSQGVLVVEGAIKSGTKNIATHAANQGRDVFAIPGPISSVHSQTPNDLIKNGAKLVTSVNDILEELNY